MNDSEEYRHQCEVRQLLKWRVQGNRKRITYHMDGLDRKRGKAAVQRLRGDANDQWAKGNRGEHGDWR